MENIAFYVAFGTMILFIGAFAQLMNKSDTFLVGILWLAAIISFISWMIILGEPLC